MQTRKISPFYSFICTLALGGTVNPSILVSSPMQPIYLKPGQCIMMGAQQVCAMMPDGQPPMPPPPPPGPMKVSHCRWGAFDEADKKASGWAHLLLTLKEDGTKQETVVRYFGPADKEGCEKAARETQRQLKKP